MRTNYLCLGLCLPIFIGACASSEGEDEAIETDDHLYVSGQTLWSSPVIPVCWENPLPSHATARSWVRDAVADTWEAVSAVDFTGWGTCNTDSLGIRIRIADENPYVLSFGSSLDGRDGGMLLNFTFASWEPERQDTLEYCIRAIAVHEFGHALGFAHEQDRSDTPNWCDEEQGANGSFTIGAWDLDSVMNYCNPDWSGDGNLSDTDIAGVIETYGTGENTHFAPEVTNFTPGLEASYFPDPDGPLYAITDLALRMRNGNIVTMRVGRREVLDNGTLGPRQFLRFGTDRGGGLEQSVSLPDGVMATGFIVRADNDAITHLALRGRPFLSSGELGAEQIYPAGCCSAIEANVTVSSREILTGIGFRASGSDVFWYGYSSRVPLYTERAGGNGGSGYVLPCPSGQVAVGTVQSPSADGQVVGMFGVLCASRAQVLNGNSIPLANMNVARGSYRSGNITRAASVGSYSSYLPLRPAGTVEEVCDNGYALLGVYVSSGALIDRIYSDHCIKLANVSGPGGYWTQVNVGGSGGGSIVLDCPIGHEVDGLYVRSGWTTDAIQLRCQP